MLPIALSVNFTLAEFQAVSNRPITEADIPTLQYLVNQILQPLRRVWGPIRVTSYIRTGDIAAGRGGAHVNGGAVDFVPVNATIDEVFTWAAINLPSVFGRIINERDHIHVTRPGGENWAGYGVVLYEPTEGNYVLATVAAPALASVFGLPTLALGLLLGAILYFVARKIA